MNKLLNSLTRETIKDLELYNVIVVEGFYTNIISQVLLRNIGYQTYNQELMLLQGESRKEVVIKKLVIEQNLTFLKYKSLFNYFKLLFCEYDLI